MTTAPGPRPPGARHRSWPWCRQCSGIALDLGSARTRAWTSGRRGALLAGGGALRPDITYHLTGQLHAPLQPVPAPHTAAVRGAAKLLQAVHTHPSTITVTGSAHPR
ncbi:hypothetical protein [Streptomyces sp. SID12488]|uniref:hypothetical protein n=1 Tax=Streptomyces sp. SID12488 TaxID=2706040 RepID=UPI0013DC3BB3|nr:hypothetical protein [Streptomyces sp. SID12488]NEA63981.1 hypothetical protein [Streptomyces sp. SID12488]